MHRGITGKFIAPGNKRSIIFNVTKKTKLIRWKRLFACSVLSSHCEQRNLRNSVTCFWDTRISKTDLSSFLTWNGLKGKSYKHTQSNWIWIECKMIKCLNIQLQKTNGNEIWFHWWVLTWKAQQMTSLGTSRSSFRWSLVQNHCRLKRRKDKTDHQKLNFRWDTLFPFAKFTCVACADALISERRWPTKKDNAKLDLLT